MPKFGRKSKKNLKTCDKDLQYLFNEVIKYFDCSILEGYRGKAEQDKVYAQGKSQVRYPDGNHNQNPSKAVDVVPYPIDWKDRERMTYFAGFVKGVAFMLGVPIAWGGDWNNNTEVKDNSFDDLPHFELREF